MFEEPFRWMEAIATRHSYVQDKLKKGQPVFAVPYNEGSLLLSFAQQSGKIFEIYDRIALGGLGHPADVERLRMSLLDMAHLEGFNRSSQDVTIARLLQFGVAPALKQNFEEVMRAPYLVQLLLAELDHEGGRRFYRLNYDGHWENFKKGAVVAGDPKTTQWLEKKIHQTPFADYDLDRAMQEVCKLWEGAHKEVRESDEKDEEDESEIPTLKQAFEDWNFEAAVLCHAVDRKSIFRKVSDDEIQRLKAALIG